MYISRTVSQWFLLYVNSIYFRRVPLFEGLNKSQTQYNWVVLHKRKEMMGTGELATVCAAHSSPVCH